MDWLKAFLHGMQEFRCMSTARYADIRLQDAYDLGREWTNRVTFRRYN